LAFEAPSATACPAVFVQSSALSLTEAVAVGLDAVDRDCGRERGVLARLARLPLERPRFGLGRVDAAFVLDRFDRALALDRFAPAFVLDRFDCVLALDRFDRALVLELRLFCRAALRPLELFVFGVVACAISLLAELVDPAFPGSPRIVS
jgi:hypothetical protein